MTPTKQQINANNPPGEMDAKTKDKIKRGEIVVTDKTEAGRRINEMFKKWELMQLGQKFDDIELKPWWRGKTLCFFYYKNEPLCTLGPDWKWTVVELIALNAVMYYVI